MYYYTANHNTAVFESFVWPWGFENKILKFFLVIR